MYINSVCIIILVSVVLVVPYHTSVRPYCNCFVLRKEYWCLLPRLHLYGYFITEFSCLLQYEQRKTWNTAFGSEMIKMGAKLGKRLNHCLICNKSYSTKGALQRHVRYECGVEPQFKCHLCDRRFCHNYHLKTHLILHERRSFLQWICKWFYGL